MSLIAKDSGGMEIEKLEPGVYLATSQAIIDLGMQNSEKFNKTQRKFMMIWKIIGEDIEINGERQARTMHKEYTYSLHEKSSLRKDLQAWRGKPFTEEELKEFPLTKILNVSCQLQIIQEEKNGKTYNSIAGIMSLSKGMSQTKIDDIYIFDLESSDTFKDWNKIPKWIKEKIKKAENYQDSGLKDYIDEIEGKEIENESNVNSTIADDDLPF